MEGCGGDVGDGGSGGDVIWEGFGSSGGDLVKGAGNGEEDAMQAEEGAILVVGVCETSGFIVLSTEEAEQDVFRSSERLLLFF